MFGDTHSSDRVRNGMQKFILAAAAHGAANKSPYIAHLPYFREKKLGTVQMLTQITTRRHLNWAHKSLRVLCEFYLH